MTRPDYETYRKMMEQQTDAAEDDEECFTAEQIAEHLGISVEEFHSRAAHGDLRPVEIEGQYVYRFKGVMRFLINVGLIEGESQW